MPRLFRFRVREGHQIHTFGDDAGTHGPGYEFVLSEQDAARVLRDRHRRDTFDLVEVIADDEAVTPSAEPPERD